jgi:hypothetical protein
MARNAREKVFELGLRAALIACQAMSIAITVVLPAPAASFNAMRNRSGLAPSLGSLQPIEEAPAAVRPWARLLPARSLSRRLRPGRRTAGAWFLIASLKAMGVSSLRLD